MRYPTETEIAKSLGERVVKLRGVKGLSQADLCYEIDIDLSTLSRLERGALNPTLHTLYKIAKYFKVEIKELL